MAALVSRETIRRIDWALTGRLKFMFHVEQLAAKMKIGRGGRLKRLYNLASAHRLLEAHYVFSC